MTLHCPTDRAHVLLLLPVGVRCMDCGWESAPAVVGDRDEQALTVVQQPIVRSDVLLNGVALITGAITQACYGGFGPLPELKDWR